jgi:hypothetical protein
MESAGQLVLYGPALEGRLGECYRCAGCNRLYSAVAGYFFFRQGEGMRDRRLSPECHEDSTIMYLQSGDDSGHGGIFACPRCGQTEHKILVR